MAAIPSQGVLIDDTKNQLTTMSAMLEKDIVDLVQDADSVRKIFLAVKNSLPSNLAKALAPVLIIETKLPR